MNPKEMGGEKTRNFFFFFTTSTFMFPYIAVFFMIRCLGIKQRKNQVERKLFLILLRRLAHLSGLYTNYTAKLPPDFSAGIF